MSTARKKNLAKLKKLGFTVSPSLPTKREDIERLRPAKEIRVRMLALMALFRWVVKTGKEMRKSELRAAMSQSERAIYALTQAKAKAHAPQMGWKLENIWPLAWIFGFEKEPSVSGDMIDEKTIGALLEFVPDVIQVRPAREVLDLEDLFYCAHNAARSAALGGKTVPKGFDPLMSTGVIHERRHALTWAVSPKVAWDDTDLST